MATVPSMAVNHALHPNQALCQRHDETRPDLQALVRPAAYQARDENPCDCVCTRFQLGSLAIVIFASDRLPPTRQEVFGSGRDV